MKWDEWEISNEIYKSGLDGVCNYIEIQQILMDTEIQFEV